jgi:Vitamin B12 dependent methionine synthase, activation domain
MRRVWDIPRARIQPDPSAVWEQQGVPAGIDPGPIADIAREACQLLASLSAPKGILADIDSSTFAEIYPGRGQNSPRSPLADIHPRAEKLALFAVTVGPSVSRRIDQLFGEHDYPLAAALDAAASLAADGAAAWVEKQFSSHCDPGQGVLRYSPGYCGWHVSAQIKLFATLKPEEIGITLGESCLMDPLKSVSGVVVAGPPAMHDFAPNFDFCAVCADRQCRDRIAHVLSAAKKET